MAHHRTSSSIMILTLFAIFIVITFIVSTCKPGQKVPDVLSQASVGMDTAKNRSLTWNVLFKPGTNATKRNFAIYKLQEELQADIKKIKPDYRWVFKIFYCPCDSLLFNLNGSAINGEGESVTIPPPPTSPRTAGGGGDVLYISTNNAIAESNVEPAPKDPVRIMINEGLKHDDRVLAIIDTGLDTTRFTRGIQEYIWYPPTGVPRIFNYVGGTLGKFDDDHEGKHGTAVTALALHAMDSAPARPKLMILKALDFEKKGSTFTISCALSYAIQNRATIINASLGYYSKNSVVDSVFWHYINTCNAGNPAPIPIFAAAGNRQGVHLPDLICNDSDPGMQLTEVRAFYPASFSETMKNIISVSTLNPSTGESCFFQNYSPKYVSIGVETGKLSQCCAFYMPFLKNYVEGTSFATPIACGRIMGNMLSNVDGNFASSLNSSGRMETRWGPYVRGGRILTYQDNVIW